MSTALIPSLAQSLKTQDKPAAFALLNQTISRVSTALATALICGWIVLFAVRFLPELPERYYWMSNYGLILLPYMLLVCIAGLLAGGLHVFQRFTISGLAQVWLNLALILALIALAWRGTVPTANSVFVLCAAVLIGGCFQLSVPTWALIRLGWQPRWDTRNSSEIISLQHLFWPSLAGAAVLQINQGITQMLALSVDASAASLLYLANRLLELPLGVFVIAVTTVAFPRLAHLAAKDKKSDFTATFQQALTQIFAILPYKCSPGKQDLDDRMTQKI